MINDISSKLKIRKFLRNPLVCLISYLLLIVSICWLGSKVIWWGYHWYQLPSMLGVLISGISGAMAAILLPLIVAPSLRFGFRDLHNKIIRFYRHGVITITCLLLAMPLFLGAITYPDKDHFTGFFKNLEKPAHEQDDSKKILTHFRTLPKFMDSEILDFAEFCLDFKLHKNTWTEVEYERVRLKAKNYLHLKSPDHEAWARYIYGEALIQVEREDEALDNYKHMTMLDISSDYLKYLAYNRLGYTYYVTQNYERAVRAWISSSKINPTRSSFENIGWYYMDVAGDFTKAKQYYDLAYQDVIKRSKNNTIRREDEVRYYLNRANFERKFAEEAAGTVEEKLDAYNRAWKNIDTAKRLDSTYMDPYLTGTLIGFSQRNIDRVFRYLDEARAVVTNDAILQNSRHNDTEYYEISKAYSAWLYIRSAFIFNNKLKSEHKQYVLDAIPGIQYETYAKAKEVLVETDKRGYTTHDCQRDLEAMKASGFLSKIKLTLASQ